MSTITIRIEDELKKKAAKQADELGVTLTLIIKNALKNFVSSPKVLIGEPEKVFLTERLQQDLKEFEDLASKIDVSKIPSLEEQMKDLYEDSI